MNSFVDRHATKIRGVLSCFGRVVITGTLPDVCHADAMAPYLSGRGVRLFDYPRWAKPFRDELLAHTERLAGGDRLHPFRPQFYFNGHHALARQLDHAGLAYVLLENAFVNLADFARAQALADAFPVRWLHRLLDRFAREYCPVLRHFRAVTTGASWRWSTPPT